MRAVTFSAPRTGRLYRTREGLWYSLLEAESTPGPCAVNWVNWKILKRPPSGIEPATVRLIEQCLNQLRHRVPLHRALMIAKRGLLAKGSSDTSITLVLHTYRPIFFRYFLQQHELVAEYFSLFTKISSVSLMQWLSHCVRLKDFLLLHRKNIIENLTYQRFCNCSEVLNIVLVFFKSHACHFSVRNAINVTACRNTLLMLSVFRSLLVCP